MGAGFKEEDSRHVEVLICLFPKTQSMALKHPRLPARRPWGDASFREHPCYLPPSTKGTDRLGRPPLLDNSTSGQPQSSSKQHKEVCPTGRAPRFRHLLTPECKSPPWRPLGMQKGHWETEEELYLLSRED